MSSEPKNKSYRGIIKADDLKKWEDDMIALTGDKWPISRCANELEIPFYTYRQYRRGTSPIPSVVGVAMEGLTAKYGMSKS